MNGGKLVQHQENPAYIHPIKTNKYGTINVSSTHHQAQYPFNLPSYKYRIIGWTENQSAMHLDGNQKELNPKVECDIVYYPGTRCLALQNHPEYIDYQEKCPKDLKVIQQIFADFMEGNL